VPHALIVEDDADSAEMLAEIVAAEGFSTATAGSLLDARRQLAFRTPDIVLLDLTLPDGSGIELFDSVDRRDSEVVLITGQASIETSVQALRLGAADYLIKPVNVDRLRAVLARSSAAGGHARATSARSRTSWTPKADSGGCGAAPCRCARCIGRSHGLPRPQSPR